MAAVDSSPQLHLSLIRLSDCNLRRLIKDYHPISGIEQWPLYRASRGTAGGLVELGRIS